MTLPAKFTLILVLLQATSGPLFAQSAGEPTESTARDQANRGAIKNIDFDEPPKLLWKHIGDEMPLFLGLVVHDGVVAVIQRKNRVIGLDARSGATIWANQLDDIFCYGFGIVMTCDPEFDAVIVGADNGLYALDRSTGALLWKHGIAKGVSGPSIAGGLVIAGGSDGKVHAVDLQSGKERWTHDFMPDAPEDPDGVVGEKARFEGRAARCLRAATDGETVFISVFDQCRTLALDVKTGERRWAFQMQGWTNSRPTVTADAVYVASQDNHFYAINKQTGDQVWSIETAANNYASPAVSDQRILFGCSDGNVYAMLRHMGSPAWQYDTADGGKPTRGLASQPLVSQGVLYQPVTGSGEIHAIDLETGEKKWKMTPLAGSEINGDPQFDQSRMFLITRQGKGEGGFATGESAIIAIGME